MSHSYLYVPGDRPDLMAKAMAGEAHAVIIDLEDGVAHSAADTARHATREFLSTDRQRPKPIAVRVHPGRLPEDLELSVDVGADMVYLPKAESDSIEACERLLDGAPMPLVALIETAQGLLGASAIAHTDRVIALALGEADLFAELGVDPELPDAERTALRLPLVVASAAAGLRGPTAPASTDYRDLDRFRQSCAHLRRIGFAARSAIHPAQVPVINDVFAPSPDEVAAASELVRTFDEAAADGTGVIVGDDGTMIDAAVVRSARRLLD